jgi:16S rRNA (guanine966-N2)-methyltransferase
LKAPRGTATRPTAERVRGAIFNILGARVEGARVADLFAGTGALGLEAWSRGAARVDFYESGPAARRTLVENIRALGVSAHCRVHPGALPGALASGGPWDLVLADPPWDQVWGPELARKLLERGQLAAAGALVLEEAYRLRTGPEVWAGLGFEVRTERRYGDTAIIVLAPPLGLG